MTDDQDERSIPVVKDNFLYERERLLALPPEKAMDLIFEHPRATDLVQSFPEQDFYFLIHDIGPEDSLELLAMASEAQWEYILDLESWQRDRMDPAALTRWFDLLLKADPGRLVHWLLKDRLELVEFYLFKNIEVIIREHDQDPADFGKGFFTFDDVFYVRIVGSPGMETESPDEKTRHEVLELLLKRLAEFDHVQFQHVLLEAGSLIPAEAEEEAYRLRNVRLAEKGLLPLEEAMGIYQYLKPSALQARQTTTSSGYSENGALLPIPLYPSKMMEGENLFTNSLRLVDGTGVLAQIQTEFVALCNQIVTADQKKIHDRDALREVVKKACGYLSIGLGRLLDLKNLPPEQQKKVSADHLKRFSILELFQVGYGSALELKWQTEKWHQNSWFKKVGLPLSFWGEAWTGVLGGLLLKRPLCYDDYKTGVLYREFSSSADISRTEKELETIMAFDDLLAHLKVSARPAKANTVLNYKNLVLTLWARNYLGIGKKPQPLTLDEFKDFFRALWTREDTPRKINQALKTSFLNWLADETGMGAGDIGSRLGDCFDRLFHEIESEYGYVSETDLDPKYIHLFLLSPG